jgi:hypothetical protein
VRFRCNRWRRRCAPCGARRSGGQGERVGIGSDTSPSGRVTSGARFVPAPVLQRKRHTTREATEVWIWVASTVCGSAIVTLVQQSRRDSSEDNSCRETVALVALLE